MESSQIALKPHCPDHPRYQSECAICQRAVANSLPYPLSKSAKKPLPRTYGYTDDLTEAKLGDPMAPGTTRGLGLSDEASLSLKALRIILRLIWPFGKII